MIGDKFGRLTVISYSHSKNYRKYWECKCECGNTHFVQSRLLNNGGVRSCGCLMKETSKKNCKNMHLKSSSATRNEKIHLNGKKHPLYFVWKAIRQRCYNSNSTGYRWYGSKNIKLCALWHDPVEFIEWGKNNGWKEGLTIDRVDPNQNYQPENCRFITRRENTIRSNKKRKTEEEIRAKRKEYHKKYYLTNRDKILENAKKYYLENLDKCLATG